MHKSPQVTQLSLVNSETSKALAAARAEAERYRAHALGLAAQTSSLATALASAKVTIVGGFTAQALIGNVNDSLTSGRSASYT
jgi:hypothetical protein